MCKLSETNIYWCCWRYSSAQAKFSNILSIWANKNGNKSAILNFILKLFYRIHRTIIVNECVNYQKQIFIGVVGDIHLHRQNFQIFCQFGQTKMAISQSF